MPTWLMTIAVGAFVTSSCAAVGGVIQQQKAQAASQARDEEREKAESARERVREKAMDELKDTLDRMASRVDKLQDDISARMVDRFTAVQAAQLEARLQAQINELRSRER